MVKSRYRLAGPQGEDQVHPPPTGLLNNNPTKLSRDIRNRERSFTSASLYFSVPAGYLIVSCIPQKRRPLPLPHRDMQQIAYPCVYCAPSLTLSRPVIPIVRCAHPAVHSGASPPPHIHPASPSPSAPQAYRPAPCRNAGYVPGRGYPPGISASPFPQLLFHAVQHLQGAAGRPSVYWISLRMAHAPPIVQRAAADSPSRLPECDGVRSRCKTYPTATPAAPAARCHPANGGTGRHPGGQGQAPRVTGHRTAPHPPGPQNAVDDPVLQTARAAAPVPPGRTVRSPWANALTAQGCRRWGWPPQYPYPLRPAHTPARMPANRSSSCGDSRCAPQ